jgi:hypothetical protein
VRDSLDEKIGSPLNGSSIFPLKEDNVYLTLHVSAFSAVIRYSTKVL